MIQHTQASPTEATAHPKRKPGGQPGNQNARSHGAYAGDQPTANRELARLAAAAIDTGDPASIRRIARALHSRGKRQLASALRRVARELAGQPTRRRNPTKPDTITRDPWQDDWPAREGGELL